MSKWKCSNLECPLMRQIDMTRARKAMLDRLTGWDGEREPTKAELEQMERELQMIGISDRHDSLKSNAVPPKRP